jgi:hypothetical protein
MAWLSIGLASAQGYEEDPAFRGTTVSGRVILSGVVPKPERMPVHRDSKFCGETIAIERVQVDRTSHGIDAVVVSLEGIERGKPAVQEKTVITFENRTCHFVPRTNVAVVNSMLEIRNLDPILHNTHIRVEDRSGPTVINVVQPAGSGVIRRALRTAGLLDVRCDAHTFMHAAIHVFDHPYFAVTDAAGRFELTHVPPGTYALRLWHDALGARTKSITVPSAGTLALDLEVGLEG